jgi:hypothetical protein
MAESRATKSSVTKSQLAIQWLNLLWPDPNDWNPNDDWIHNVGIPSPFIKVSDWIPSNWIPSEWIQTSYKNDWIHSDLILIHNGLMPTGWNPKFFVSSLLVILESPFFKSSYCFSWIAWQTWVLHNHSSLMGQSYKTLWCCKLLHQNYIRLLIPWLLPFLVGGMSVLLACPQVMSFS